MHFKLRHYPFAVSSKAATPAQRDITRLHPTIAGCGWLPASVNNDPGREHFVEMTLVVALKAANGIVVAADSRGTIGDPRGLTATTDKQRKIFKFGNCVLAAGGASSLANTLIDELNKRGLSSPTDIDAAVSVFASAAEICDGWFRSISVDERPAAVFTVAGYRREDSHFRPMIYSMVSTNHFAPELQDDMAMIGTAQYALYLSHRYYSPNLNLQSASALAAYLISETATQDQKVGGPIRISQVTPGGGYGELTSQDVRSLMARNRRLNGRLADFFANGG